MKETYQFGLEASSTPSVLDWKRFYQNIIVPTYHFQPALSERILGQFYPVELDGKDFGEVYKEEDIDDITVSFETVHDDTKPVGSAQPVYFPKMQKSALFSDREMQIAMVGRSRLRTFVTKVIAKMKDKKDRLWFQGDSEHKLTGTIGTDSTDLNNPTGVWDVDAGSNGKLGNALADIDKVVNHFMDEGLGGRPIYICMTNEAYQLLNGTEILYESKTNLDLALNKLPPGSWIAASNNLQATPPEGGKADNTMVAFVKLMENPVEGTTDEDGYVRWESPVVQKMHKVDVDQWRYWLGQRIGLKVNDSAYVCYMDEIDCVT